jgi:hypothetical protein
LGQLWQRNDHFFLVFEISKCTGIVGMVDMVGVVGIGMVGGVGIGFGVGIVKIVGMVRILEMPVLKLRVTGIELHVLVQGTGNFQIRGHQSFEFFWTGQQHIWAMIEIQWYIIALRMKRKISRGQW